MRNSVHNGGNQRHDSGLNLLMTIFKRAFPVWERYNGAVPPEALAKLDEAGDWPCGLAAAVMKRLSRDHELRNRLGEFLNG
jgi:hypothetical protein